MSRDYNFTLFHIGKNGHVRCVQIYFTGTTGHLYYDCAAAGNTTAANGMLGMHTGNGQHSVMTSHAPPPPYNTSPGAGGVMGHQWGGLHGIQQGLTPDDQQQNSCGGGGFSNNSLPPSSGTQTASFFSLYDRKTI